MGTPSRSITMNTLFSGLSHRGGWMRSWAWLDVTAYSVTPYSVRRLRSPSGRCDVGSGSTRMNPQPSARAPPSASSLSPTITACAGIDAQPRNAVSKIAAFG